MVLNMTDQNLVDDTLPFHDDTNPSLSINLNIGCFNCFACGTKGGDLIAFHMKFKKSVLSMHVKI
jgi:DNA primase